MTVEAETVSSHRTDFIFPAPRKNGANEMSDPLVAPYFPCAECWGQGEIGFDRNESHARGEYVGYECDTCGGSGFAQRGHLLEALGAEWHCGHAEQGHEPCDPEEPHRHDWSCHWAVKQ